MGVSYKVVPFKFNMATYNKNFLSFILYPVRFCYYWILNKYSYPLILKIIEENGIDVIHSNNSWISIGFEIAKQKRIKHVWHLREMSDLHFYMRSFKPFEKLCEDFNNSDSVICVSEAVKRHFHIRNKNAVVLYDAVDSIRNIQDVHYEKENYFLYCGGLSENKGVLDAISSFSKVSRNRNIRLYIAGTGSAHFVKKMKSLIEKEGIERKVVLLGYRTDAKELMRKAVALLMCSWHEAYGRVTVEAMMNDCVVIGRNSGGTSELIEHEETGFLFDSNSELEALMEKVLDMDTTIIRDKAREKAIHSFTEEVYGEQLKKVYDNLLIQNHKTTQE
ncbi:glycosyltransferase [Parabacteroides distasonis]|uniref:Glycosyltransferase n=3 Tax=Parabacteroides distasonis TaxID=823 RepID=A0AB35JA55_PARDI|nr:glycosyltransferase [Parabacteroides distasonis]MDB9006004.1 glycosyltransferase [Parabacteroides distasonis]MDB9009871.1 glycosyltransferase [Parabacteroides distasonis]MDB9022812.1 glycosyltransferase [Parabacteroides distasonis]